MKKFICGIIIGSICTMSIGSLANGVWDSISVLRNDINVVVNGETVEADNFLYNDTTYLPLRAVSTALGENVEYDEVTNTAYIGERKTNVMNNNSFIGKYDPTDYDEYSINIFKKDNVYYAHASDCKNLLLNANLLNKAEIGEKSVKYFLKSGEIKELNGYTVNIGGIADVYCILFDDFVDEIEPLLR